VELCLLQRRPGSAKRARRREQLFSPSNRFSVFCWTTRALRRSREDEEKDGASSRKHSSAREYVSAIRLRYCHRSSAAPSLLLSITLTICLRNRERSRATRASSGRSVGRSVVKREIYVTQMQKGSPSLTGKSGLARCKWKIAIGQTLRI